MKSIQLLFIAILFAFVFNVGSHYVFADDDDVYEHKEDFRENDEKEGALEEIGKTVGWGTAIAMGTAGVIFPLRRSTKRLITTVPSFKEMIISFSKFLGKYHVLIGSFALLLGVTHGISMLITEPEFELNTFTGIGTIVILLIAALFGTVLNKNKKSKKARKSHLFLITISILLGVFHIL